MNIKINTICFIFLLFLLIGVASASDNDNETLKQTIEHDDKEPYQMSLDSQDELKASNENSQKLEASINKEKLEASKSSPKILSSLKLYTKQKVSIKAPDVKMYYKDGSQFTVTIKDSNKKVIKKAKVKISINGKTYTKTTNSKGKATLNLNLKSGKYSVVTTFDETKSYSKASAKSTVTIKSTIKCSDFSKYYTNKAAYYSTFYDKKGKLLKETSVKFKINTKSYTVKTNKKGVGKLAIDLKPGSYSVSSINSKTSETITKTITIKTILETHDLTMTEQDGSKFSVKVLNCYGKVSPNKKVTLKVNGKTYTPTSNSNGIATQTIDLVAGKYSITTEYEGLKHTNQITVNKGITSTPFSHITSIPNYVNVTVPYVFQNSAYSLKTGTDGIIRMPKNDVYTIQISETQGYLFSQAKIDGVDSTVIGYKTHLVPFDGSGIKSDFNKANLKGEGILISSGVNYTEIEYRSATAENTEMFGIYMNKGLQNSETITYVQNNKIKAMVNFYTYNYDELGLKYSLSKFYGKTIYDFNYKSYDEITQNNANSIKFVNTGTPVTFSYFGRSIVGPVSKENIMTKFLVNGRQELEKGEIISYGLGEKYRSTIGFEVLQSYAIINEKMTQNILENWVGKSQAYLSRYGIMNIYSMFLASIESAWFADKIADEYAKEFSVNWVRDSPVTILGGINLDNTYINILNADMGMKVTGNSMNIELFRMMNSLNLPNIEDYALEPVSNRYDDKTMNSLDNVLYSIANNNYSITQLGDLLYVFDNNRSAIVLNTTNGVSNVIISDGNSVYKGSLINTRDDCCSICNSANDIVNRIKTNINKFKSSNSDLLDKLNKLHPLSMLAYQALKVILGKVATGTASVPLSIFNIMAIVQTAGVTYRTGTVEEKDWHKVMDTYTFTRSGYLQGKKVYNIPNNKGGHDYIEVPIKSDLTLDRTNAKYISQGQTKKLTKQETYQYFTDDYWSPFSMPTKYWDKSWR